MGLVEIKAVAHRQTLSSPYDRKRTGEHSFGRNHPENRRTQPEMPRINPVFSLRVTPTYLYVPAGEQWERGRSYPASVPVLRGGTPQRGTRRKTSLGNAATAAVVVGFAASHGPPSVAHPTQLRLRRASLPSQKNARRSLKTSSPFFAFFLFRRRPIPACPSLSSRLDRCLVPPSFSTLLCTLYSNSSARNKKTKTKEKGKIWERERTRRRWRDAK